MGYLLYCVDVMSNNTVLNIATGDNLAHVDYSMTLTTPYKVRAGIDDNGNQYYYTRLSTSSRC